MKRIIIVGDGISGRRLKKYVEKKFIDIQMFDDKNPVEIDWNVDGIFFSPGINNFPVLHHMAIKAIDNKVPTINDIDILYSFNSKSKYIGVTGTIGKTTICDMIHYFLKHSNIPHCYTGNSNGNDFEDADLYLLELSSYQLNTINWLTLNFGVITNIFPDHLERYQCFEEYMVQKLKILRQIPNKQQLFILGDGVPKININQLQLKKINTSSLNENLQKPHNQYNLSIAITILEQLGISTPETEIINNFQFPKFRQQVIFKNNNLLIINDSKATNVFAVKSAFESYENFIWIAGGRLKTQKKLDELLQYSTRIRHAFFFGINGTDLYKYFNNYVSSTLLSLNKSIEEAIKLGGTILFSPCGDSFDEFHGFEERGNYFNQQVFNIINIVKI